MRSFRPKDKRIKVFNKLIVDFVKTTKDKNVSIEEMLWIVTILAKSTTEMAEYYGIKIVSDKENENERCYL